MLSPPAMALEVPWRSLVSGFIKILLRPKNLDEDMPKAKNYQDLDNICTPRTWRRMSSEMLLCELSERSEEFKYVSEQINKTLTAIVYAVVRIQNPYLWRSYQLKKLEYEAKNTPVKEIHMFHCTAKSKIHSIVSDNLDWRRCTHSKFGKGVSFSPSADYANKYANYDIGTERALILSTVLVGTEIQGHESMIFPPKYYDTSYGNRNHQGTMVYVKYCDHDFYPSYVAYYTCLNNPRQRSRRNYHNHPHQRSRRNGENHPRQRSRSYNDYNDNAGCQRSRSYNDYNDNAGCQIL